jgi:hypothetical protein
MSPPGFGYHECLLRHKKQISARGSAYLRDKNLKEVPMLTESVKLIDGIEYEGSIHKDAILRTPIVADALETEAQCEGKSALTFSLCLMSKRIVSLGTIPKTAINTQLLAKLSDEDYSRMLEVTEFLKKKAHWQNGN